jgi:threonylcarbamoyladenosine tRNA methylthiotransferase MtaB
MKLHVFPFSPRPGTLAEKEKPLPPDIVEERKKLLISLSEEIWKKYAKRFIGREMEVLVEKIENGLAEGLTDNYLKIVFQDSSVSKGDFVKVYLKEIGKERIFGERVRNILTVKI